MRTLKRVEVKVANVKASCMALFDSGSGITAIQRVFFEEKFGDKWFKLSKPLKVFWINGESIIVDKYTQVILIINSHELSETIFVIDEFIKEIEIEGKRIKLPELIIGSGTMDKYGIILHPKEGVKFTSTSFLF